MMKAGVVEILLVVALLCGPASAYKILIAPGVDGSHTIFLGRLGLALLERHHNVTLLVGSTFNVPNELLTSRMNLLRYYSPVPPLTSRPEFIAAAQDGLYNSSTLKLLKSFGRAEEVRQESTEHLLQDTAVVERIGAEKYDYMVVDSLTLMHGIIAHKYAIPYSIYGVDLHLHRRAPHLPSHVPCPVLLLPYTDQMSFKQRVINFLFYVLMSFVLGKNEGVDMYRKYAPELPAGSAYDLVAGADIVLALEAPYLTVPKATMPDTIRIGSLMTRPANPLPEDLNALMDSSEHGVILVSFGSWMKIPPEIFHKLVNVFAQLKQTIIWKYTDDIHMQMPANIHIRKWVPQNDLLGHGKLKLFATHGGANSVIEAIYHGVPLLCVPLGIDQGYTAEVVRSKGYAEVLNIDNFTAQELLDKLQALLSKPEYLATARRHSRIFKDIIQSGSEDPAFWIEHVIKYGRHHLRSSAYELTWYEFYMFDVLALLCVVSSSVMYLTYRIIRLCIGKLCKCGRHKKSD